MGPNHQWRSPNNQERNLSDGEINLINSLTDTFYFNRLHKISFLGIIDYLTINSEQSRRHRFTRADHTFGVLALARNFMQHIKFSDEERKIVLCASICHDLGHSAFSHSTETAFKKINPFLSHKKFTEIIITSDESDVRRTLIENNVDIQRIVRLCLGDDDDPLRWLFHGSINIDTLDGMFRFLLSFLLTPPFDPVDITETLVKLYNNQTIDPEEIAQMDHFWEIKGGFYENFLVRGAYADYERDFIEKVIQIFPSVDERDFFLDEDEITRIMSLASKSKPQQKNRAPKLPPKSTFRIQPDVVVKTISDLEKRYVRRRNEGQ